MLLGGSQARFSLLARKKSNQKKRHPKSARRRWSRRRSLRCSEPGGRRELGASRGPKSPRAAVRHPSFPRTLQLERTFEHAGTQLLCLAINHPWCAAQSASMPPPHAAVAAFDLGSGELETKRPEGERAGRTRVFANSWMNCRKPGL